LTDAERIAALLIRTGPRRVMTVPGTAKAAGVAAQPPSGEASQLASETNSQPPPAVVQEPVTEKD